MNKLICLGIESTAHTLGFAIMDSDKKVYANVKHGFVTKEGGMKPVEVVDHHVEWCDKVLKECLDKSGLSLKDINLVSFSQGPGIGHMLKIGAFISRYISLKLKVPLVGVNHCIAHLTIGKALTGAKDPVLLYASGANTQIIALEGGKYRIFGETLDIGVGNFLDTFARYIGLGFPGGPKIYELALKGKNLIEIPYVVKGMDVSFTGILTNLKQKYDSGKYYKEDLCFSLQETVFAMLLEVTERAMAHCDKNELLLGGGVACNKLLQDMTKRMCYDREAKCFILENQYNVDNAAMIAWQGILEYQVMKRDPDIKRTKVKPYWRTDDVLVSWVD
tara:strand:+ start:3261 stop:4259 length:999 start_codon:yes stop_codon:yes gene_type:complete